VINGSSRVQLTTTVAEVDRFSALLTICCEISLRVWGGLTVISQFVIEELAQLHDCNVAAP